MLPSMISHISAHSKCARLLLTHLPPLKYSTSISSIKNDEEGVENKPDFDSFGTWDSTTDMPLLVDASITHGKPIPKVRLESIGLSSVKGRRVYQEDQACVQEIMPGLISCAVYDGHGGFDCSSYCALHFHKHILNWIEESKKKRSDKSKSKTKSNKTKMSEESKNEELMSVLHKSFIEVNNAYSQWFTCKGRGDELDLNSPGSTATVCLIRDSMHIIIGHVGDSRAILCRAGDARKLTTDHIPDLLTEKIRIEKSGGKILNHRVNGRLAMTRSIGDLELKKYGVIPEPDLVSLRISHSRDAFLVLTTDGINSVMTDQEIADVVKQASDPTEAAHLLTDTALQYSSEDNLTAIVIPLGSWGKYSAAATIFHSFGKSFGSSKRFS